MVNEITDELHALAKKLMRPEYNVPGGTAFDLNRIISKIRKEYAQMVHDAQDTTLIDIMSYYQGEYDEICRREIRDTDEVAKMILSNEIMETITHLMRQIRDYRKL